MKTLSIANHKGGSGKTTTAYHLATIMGRNRVKTLLIDLDPQHNLTDAMWDGTRAPGICTIADVLGGLAPAQPLTDAIQAVTAYLSMVNSERALANVALGLLADVVKGRSALRRVLQSVERRFELVIIDCPPDMGILLVNALFASDGIIVPGEPEAPAIAGMQTIIDMAATVRAEMERQTPIVLGAIATKIDRRTKRHEAGLVRIGADLAVPILGEIPERNGNLRDTELKLAYAPIGEKLCDWLGV